MLWFRESLLMNVTCDPGFTNIEDGLTPAGVMVIVVVSTPGPDGPAGESELLLPQPVAASRTHAASARLINAVFCQVIGQGPLADAHQLGRILLYTA